MFEPKVQLVQWDFEMRTSWLAIKRDSDHLTFQRALQIYTPMLS